MSLAALQGKDISIVIDKSGSMTDPFNGSNISCWVKVQEYATAVALQVEQIDPDGIDVYVFSGNYKHHPSVTSAKVADVFKEHYPMGSTDLSKVLEAVFNNYFAKKASGKAKPNGDIVIVFTDGEPDDKKKVYETVIKASNKLDRDEEMTVLICALSKSVNDFLRNLDDNLKGPGLAKFDIVDCIPLEDLEAAPLMEILLNAISD